MFKALSRKILFNIIIFSAFSFNSIAIAEYLSFFSPKDDVNYHIMRAINSVSTSIELAISDIKSKEIAQTLVNAHNRGVYVRILFKNKDIINDNSQLKYLSSNGIKAWILEDKSINVDNFAIFDKKLLLIGSFSMDQKTFQNITFTDDNKGLQQYQSTFEGFANLKLTPAERMFVPQSNQGAWQGTGGPSQSNQGSWQITAPQQSGQPWKEKFVPPDMKFPEQMVNLSFKEMNSIFGKHSTLSRSEKKRRWKDFKGKYITWTGKISYVAWGVMTGDIMGVIHEDAAEVIINIKDVYVNHVKRLHKGDTVTYRGRLARRPKWFTGFKIKDGEVLTR